MGGLREGMMVGVVQHRGEIVCSRRMRRKPCGEGSM